MKTLNNSSVVATIVAVSFYGLLKLSGGDTYWAAFVTFTLLILAAAAYQYVWRRGIFPVGAWKFLPLIGLSLASLTLVLQYPVYVGVLLACAGFAAYFVFLVRRRTES